MAEKDLVKLKQEFAKLLDFFASFDEASKREEVKKALEDGVIDQKGLENINGLVERAKFLKEYFDFISFDGVYQMKNVEAVLEIAKRYSSTGDFASLSLMSILDDIEVSVYKSNFQNTSFAI